MILDVSNINALEREMRISTDPIERAGFIGRYEGYRTDIELKQERIRDLERRLDDLKRLDNLKRLDILRR